MTAIYKKIFTFIPERNSNTCHCRFPTCHSRAGMSPLHVLSRGGNPDDKNKQKVPSLFLFMTWLLPLFALLISGCGESKSENTPNEPLITKSQPKGEYVHPVSQMVFAEKIGDFEREQISVYDESGENISVEYISKFLGLTSSVIKVYIYPAPSADFMATSSLGDHYKDQKDSLLDIFPSAYEIEQGDIKIGQPFGPQQGMMLTFKRKPNEVFPRKDCYEKLYLFEHGKWIIKYRVTYPTGNEKQLSKSADSFMQLLQWPQ